MNRARGRWAVLPLLGLLALGMALSVREGVVSVLWQGLNANVVSWTRDDQSVDLSTWERLRVYGDLALSWDAADPQLLQTLGAIYWRGGWLYGAGTRNAEPLMDQGLDSYRRAILLRPAWPDAWLYLALAKDWKGEWDEEFQRAYEMALRFGGWRRPVLRRAVELGLAAGSRFSPVNRRHFITALDRVAQRDPAWLKRIAERQGGSRLLCLVLRERGVSPVFCDR